MLQQDLMLVFFFFLLSASRYSKQQPQVGQKLQKADSLKTREEPDKMGYHSKCNKMYFIFFESRWNGGKKITTDFRHFLGHHIAQNTGQSISISIPWGQGSLYREIVYISLDYKPRSKHGVNRILQRVWWSGQECTALHTNWSQSRERYWQATGLGQTHRPDCSCSAQYDTLG